MYRWASALAAMMLLNAAPVLAAPCRTQGMAEASIDFPTGKADDVPFARSMVPAIVPEVSGALPQSLTCTRSTIHTALGDYAIGGENGDAYPRMALPADGKPGPTVYLAASPAAPGKLALVVHPQNWADRRQAFLHRNPDGCAAGRRYSRGSGR